MTPTLRYLRDKIKRLLDIEQFIPTPLCEDYNKLLMKEKGICQDSVLCHKVSDPLGEDPKYEKQKPPLGVMPRRRHEELRKEHLKDAILRYVAVEKRYPVEWVHELNELTASLSRRNQMKKQIGFDVFIPTINGETLIDTVYFDEDMTEEDVRKSLINLDGHSTRIIVRK